MSLLIRRGSLMATSTINGTPEGPQAPDYATVSTPWLPWDMPTPAAAGTGRPVVMHPMGNFLPNISNDNQLGGGNDYWLNNWRANPSTSAYPPNAAEAWQRAGGECRDWPIRRAARSGLSSDASEAADVADWVAECARNGIDQFAPHFPNNNNTSVEWRRAVAWLDGAIAYNAANPGAKCGWTPWIDGSTSIADSTTAMTLGGQRLASLYASKSAGWWKYEGRPVFLCYSPNQAGPSPSSTNWSQAAEDVWIALRAALVGNGVPNPLLWVVYQSGTWHTLHAQYNSDSTVFDACSRFGERDPVITAGMNVGNRLASSTAQSNFTQPWMTPCSARGYYPRGGTDSANPGTPRAWEARGFDQLIASSMSAIGQPNTAAMCWNTGNDFPEHTHILPSSGSKRNWMEALSYFTTWFKMGGPPRIVRDAVYMAHRKQLVGSGGEGSGGGTTYTASPPSGTSRRTVPYDSTGWPNLSNGAAPVNRVTALAFLTAPATVTIRVNGTDTSHECPAGMSTVWAAAAVSATAPRVTITRGGATVMTVNSRKKISNSLPWEDLDYYVTSSTESVTRPDLYTGVAYDDTLGDVA